MKKFKIYILILIIFPMMTLESARIKDIANIEGVSGVQVIGYGLVVGLNQTGDNRMVSYTNQSVINMLKRFGLTIDKRNNGTRNIAAVMITATIPPFMKKGSQVDVVVSAMGDATSLQGGTLLMTPLSRADGSIIGNAQGPLSVGGYDVRAFGSRITKNFVTNGRVPNGLILQKEIGQSLEDASSLRVILRQPDFTVANTVAKAINGSEGLDGKATLEDGATIKVDLSSFTERNDQLVKIAQIEALKVDLEATSKVVINERTGTIVIGGNVELLPSVIAHGGLDITIQKQVIVPQPAPFTIFPPRYAETADISVEEDINQAKVLEVKNPTVAGIAESLNLLQVKPRDLIAIFQALKESGSLQGELIIQ
ncbi:flagellar basal body P-ring protein FlgI [bacterium]|nr:MAG: flagellar basal body P-ring protein FlgI [bacterium]